MPAAASRIRHSARISSGSVTTRLSTPCPIPAALAAASSVVAPVTSQNSHPPASVPGRSGSVPSASTRSPPMPSTVAIPG